MASENSGVKQKVGSLIDNVRYYWNDPPKGKYMNFKEIALMPSAVSAPIS